MISDEIPSALSRRRSLTVSQIWRTILSVTGIRGLEGLVSVRYCSGSTVDLWSATNMNPKKKMIKFKKEIGIIADEKMVSEAYVKDAFADLQDWSICSLGCPLFIEKWTLDFHSEHPKFSSSVWNFKSKNEADEGTTMMPPYSRERKHRTAILKKYF